MLDSQVIQRGLKTVVLKPELILVDTVDSTNSIAKGLIGRGASEGLVVVAENQLSGRGRQNRQWHSPVGGLYMSVTLKPRLSPEKTPLFGLLSACAAAEAVREMTGLQVRLKWPNDIMLGERKVGGILSEVVSVGERICGIVIGIGINQNTSPSRLPDEIRESATTMLSELGHETSREELAYRTINAIDRRVANVETLSSFSPVLDEWLKTNTTVGRQIRVHEGTNVIEGTAVGVSPLGSLRVKTATGEKEVPIGDVLHV